MNRIMRRLKFGWTVAICAALSAGFFTIAGCNTVEGAGEDIENLGEGVSDAADGD